MKSSKWLQSTAGWSIGNGYVTQFWDQSWLEGISNLSEYTHTELTTADHIKKVKDHKHEGAWDLELLWQYLLKDIIHKIVGVHPPSPNNIDDYCVWKLTSSGKFSLRSMFNFLAGLTIDKEELNSAFDWKMIWKWNGPPRIRTFMWLAAKGRLLTNAQRVRRHLATSDLCPLCESHIETILHTLRDCNKAREVWEKNYSPCMEK